MGAKGIVVVGSLNLDLVVHVERIPSVGETIQGRSFQTHPGGKGANQAAEIGRLGYPVHMIGRIGSDAFGSELRDSLDTAGVNTTAVSVSAAASGIAMILVQARGENSIVVAPGANACLSVSDLDANLELIQNASLVLTQLEIPIPTLEHLTALCERECVPLILDPAPAQQLSSGVLSKVTWITPNDTEAQQLTGFKGSTESEQELRLLAEHLLEMGPRNVLLKLGSRGAYIATEDGIRAAIPAYSVDAVDTRLAMHSMVRLL
jgi:ribokinase